MELKLIVKNTRITSIVNCLRLCNDSNLQQDQGQWIIIGDPTEGALLSLAGKAGVERDRWMAHLPRVAEFPFSSERKQHERNLYVELKLAAKHSKMA